MGAIVIGTDINPPYIRALSPKNGYESLGVLAPISFRIEDYWGGFLDLDTLSVSIDGDDVIEDGAALPSGPWSESVVLPWSAGATSIADVELRRSSTHEYSHTYTINVTVADSGGNYATRSFSYKVEPDKAYNGSSISDFSDLEMSIKQAFDNQVYETFRKRVLYGIVPGATPGTDLENVATVRAVQLVSRFSKEGFVSTYWPFQKYRNGVAPLGARSISELSPIEGQFREAARQAMSINIYSLDESVMQFIEDLLKTEPVAACICLLSILCRARDEQGLS